MASKRIKGIIVEIGGDTSPLGKALKEADESAKKTQSELKDIDRALKNAPDSVVLWKQKQELLTKAIDDSKSKLKLLQDAQDEMNRKLEAGEIGEETYRNFQREVEQAKGELAKLRGELSDTNGKLEDLGKDAKDTGEKLDDMGEDAKEAGNEIDDAGDEAEGFGDKIDKAAAVAVAAGAAIVGAANMCYEAWAEVDEGYDTIITKTGATGRALEDMQSIANSVFTSLPVEMGDVGIAIGEINTRFEATGTQLETLSSHFLKFANINGTDVNSSIDNVSAAMQAFEVDVSNATNVLDTLTVVGQKTGIDMSTLEGLLVSNSATFKEMGLTIGESAQLLGQFELNGVDTATAIAGLRKAQQNATADGKTLNEALGESITAIKNSKDETTALQTATELFGKKGAAAMAQAIREGRFSLQDLSDDMTAFSGTVENTFDATQDAPDKLQISLNKLKLEGAELANKVLPKIADGAEKFNDFLPDLLNYAKKALPYVKGIGTAFVTWKAMQSLGSGISTVKKLTDVLKTTSSLASLTSTGILGIGAALAVGVGSYVYSAKKAEDARLQEIFEEATEESRNLAEEINNSAEAMKTMKEEADAQIESDKLMIDQTQRLYKELQTLCDENGNIKAGYEDRVKYISGELEEATGIEIELVDGQIKKYGELKTAIEDVIKKKRAESMESAYSGVYQQALTDNAKVTKQYREAEGIVTDNQNEIARLKLKAENSAREQYKSTSHLGEFTYENRDAWSMFLNESDLESLRAAEANIVNAQSSMATLKDAFKQNQADIENYEKATEAMLDENYSLAQAYYSQIGDLSYANLVDSKSTLKEQVQAVKSAYADALKDYETKLILGDTKAKETFSSTVASIVQQASDSGVSAGTLLSLGIVGELEKIDGFDATMLLEFANTLGIDFGTALGYVSAEKAKEILSQRIGVVQVGGTINQTVMSHFYPNGKLSAYANGGYHRTGAGIVAEAGPELIEIVNGGAKITPLTDIARNTAVSGMTKPVTIYNTIYANVSNDYDVDRLAQQLAQKERQINSGMGR